MKIRNQSIENPNFKIKSSTGFSHDITLPRPKLDDVLRYFDFDSKMASPSAMEAGDLADEASVDGYPSPNRREPADGGDHGIGFCWNKTEMDSDNAFLFEDDISPPIPIDPRYYEDPTGDGDLDDADACVFKIFPELYAAPLNKICSQVAPMLGGVSYCYFSLSNMDPSWFGK